MDMTGFPDSSARGLDFRIRRYRHDDLGAFERFWNAQGGAAFASRRVNAFRRLVEGNPFSATHNDYLVLEIEGRVAAYEGIMPFRFSVSGEDVDGFIYHDTMVDPEMRGRGLGKRFVKSILEACPEFSVAVWMNAPNMRVFERCGWLPVDSLPTYVRGYTIRNMVKTRLPVFNHAAEASVGALAGLLYRLEKSLSDYSFRGYDVGIVESFDERVDALFHAVRREFPFIAFRTGDVLNWKFMDSPSCRFVRMICSRGTELQGYLVFRVRDSHDGRRIATVYDFLCPPRRIDVFLALMRRAVIEIERQRPDTLEVLCTDRRFAGALKRLMFVRARDNPGALKYIHAESADPPPGIGRGENWFFTFGDGDRVFWDFDPG